MINMWENRCQGHALMVSVSSLRSLMYLHFRGNNSQMTQTLITCYHKNWYLSTKTVLVSHIIRTQCMQVRDAWRVKGERTCSRPCRSLTMDTRQMMRSPSARMRTHTPIASSDQPSSCTSMNQWLPVTVHTDTSENIARNEILKYTKMVKIEKWTEVR